MLDSNKLKWFYMFCAAALPQLDRGSDYESERHRFESYTPHQLKLKASGNGGFSFMATPHGFEPRSRRGRKENASVTQSGTRFPNDCPGGNRIPESKLGMGYIFRMTPQVEAATRNRAVEWDMLSPWQPRRKAHPGIAPQNGTCFPPAAPSTPKPMRPPSQNWVEESQNAIAGGQYDCRR